MALIDPRIRRIYFDVNIFIYTVEKHRDYESVLARLFKEIEKNRQRVVTSELSLAECLVGARKARSDELAAIYENLLAPSEMIVMAPLDRDILRAAAFYAADAAIKLPDAIHVVTAVALDCEMFFTNDRRVTTPAGLALLTLEGLTRAR